MRRASSLSLLTLLLLTACKPEPTPSEQGKLSGPAAEPAATTKPAPTPTTAELGATATPSVRDAMAGLTRLEGLLTSGEPVTAKAVEDARTGALTDWVLATDAALSRTDSDRITEALARLAELDGPEHDDARAGVLLVLVTQVRVAALFKMRQLLTVASDADPSQVSVAIRANQWDDAWTIWTAALRPLAHRADALERRGGEDWEATIVDAFRDGREQLDDPVAPKASRQIIEKGSYAVAYRLILANAESAKENDDAAAVSEAAVVLEQLDDRLADRNGPGLARMRQMLGGDPSQVDAAAIERELAVAFVKRARKYCDKAVAKAELGQPGAIAETWEGVVYTKVILPSMREALGGQGFDADAYAADWLDYLDAVTSNDADTAATISARLVEWNCAYQDHLGIAACTASANEPG